MIASAPRTHARSDTTDAVIFDTAREEMITPLTNEKLPRESPNPFEHDLFNPPEYDSLSDAAHAPASRHVPLQHFVASASSLQTAAEGTDENAHGPHPQPPHIHPGAAPHPASSPYPDPLRSSSPSSARAEKRKSGGGNTVLRALGNGSLAILLAPAAVAGAALAAAGFAVYGAGKLVEGIGRGLAAGPEAAGRAFVKTKRGARIRRAFGRGERDAKESRQAAHTGKSEGSKEETAGSVDVQA